MSRPNARQIIALGGGGFSMDPPQNLLLDDYILGATGVSVPKICFLPTASGDSDSYIVRFYSAFAKRNCRPSHLSLFRRSTSDISDALLDQDAVYVGGGNVADMGAVWQLHGVCAVLRAAYSAGVLLCGVSAGGMCWFNGGVTDSFGPTLSRWLEGLEFIHGLFCPHYDSELERKPAFERMVADTHLPGYALGDGVAMHFVNEEMSGCVSSRFGARAFRVKANRGIVEEEVLDVRYLGSGA